MKKFEEELSHWKDYDYAVVNNKLDTCLKKILSIIQKDKKNNDGKINLILLKKIGKAYYSRNVNKKYIIKISN